jgi:hypothetical protein
VVVRWWWPRLWVVVAAVVGGGAAATVRRRLRTLVVVLVVVVVVAVVVPLLVALLHKRNHFRARHAIFQLSRQAFVGTVRVTTRQDAQDHGTQEEGIDAGGRQVGRHAALAGGGRVGVTRGCLGVAFFF